MKTLEPASNRRKFSLRLSVTTPHKEPMEMSHDRKGPRYDTSKCYTVIKISFSAWFERRLRSSFVPHAGFSFLPSRLLNIDINIWERGIVTLVNDDPCRFIIFLRIVSRLPERFFPAFRNACLVRFHTLSRNRNIRGFLIPTDVRG